MEKQPKIGTVVLNFRAYNETIDCVESLKNQTYENHKIIIVENGSANESEQILVKRYGNDSQISIIISKENLGFAKGNNLGIRYAKEILNCDYIFVLNSDTIVPDGVFKEIIKVDCKDLGAISPFVCDINKNYAEPSENSNDIYSRIKYLRNQYHISNFLSLPIIKNIYVNYKQNKTYVVNNKKRVYGKYVLQGCAYFLTPTFFKYYTQLFPNTFLYWEEINLLVYLEKVGLHSILINTPFVVHKEKKSTDKLILDKDRLKKIYKLSNESYHNSKRMYRMTYEQIKNKFN